VPEKNRPPEDEQPLARPVQEQRLARPVGEEERETRRTQEERGEVRQAEEEAQREGKGLVDKAKGLVDKAAKIVDEVGDKLTDRQAMHFEASVEIERPVEEVFGYVTVPENLPEWAGPVVEVRDVQKAAPDQLRQGDKFTAAAKFLGRRFETPCEVTDYLSNRQFSFRSTGGPVPQEFTYILEPTLKGTHFTQSVEAQPGAFFRLTGPLFEAAGRRQINNDLETLKDLLEARG
jgi:uncharacterized protein YndB with AHSA1/START domain